MKSSSGEQHTCNMNWSPHETVVIEETGGPLSQQHLHTTGVAFLGSQVEHRTACSVLHIHIGCSLRQHTQSLPVTLISLREQRKAVKTLHSVKIKRPIRTAVKAESCSNVKHLQQDAED